MGSNQEESGYWIISQGSQANQGGKQSQTGFGVGAAGLEMVARRKDSPSLSCDASFLLVQASRPDARPPAPIYQVSVGIQGLVS